MRLTDTSSILILASLLLTARHSSSSGVDQLGNLPSSIRNRNSRPALAPTRTVPWGTGAAMHVPVNLPMTPKNKSSFEQGPLMPTSLPSLMKGSDQCLLYEDWVAPRPQATTNCAGRYHDPKATTISGPGGGLPTPSAFIKREGNLLKASSSIYRPVGPNIYWLGLDENEENGTKISYPSRKRIREAIAIAAAMGANTVRSISLGVSVGNALSVWPTKGETNEDAFQTIDYAIGTARQYGIRLIIPLTDNYRFYHGGKYTFLEWEGINSSDADAESNFYRNQDVIDTFKKYIEVILNHINRYTGIALKDDPTILAWETGNELGAFDLEQGAPPASWTSQIAQHIKSIDSKHLVIDGSDGVVDSDGDDIEGLDVDEIDIVSDHLYPPDNTTFWNDHGLSASANKALIIGEYDWTGLNGGQGLSSFFNQIVNTHSVGDIAWNVMSHDDDCCRFINHNDGYSIYYPNGNPSLLQRRLLRMVQHWYHLTGRNSPHVLPAVTCPQPEWLKEP